MLLIVEDDRHNHYGPFLSLAAVEEFCGHMTNPGIRILIDPRRQLILWGVSEEEADALLAKKDGE